MKTNQTRHAANSKKVNTASPTEITCPYAKTAKNPATTPIVRAKFISAIPLYTETVYNRQVLGSRLSS